MRKHLLSIYCSLCEDGYSEFATSVMLEHLQTTKYSTQEPDITQSIRICYDILLSSQKFCYHELQTRESFVKVLSNMLDSHVWDFTPQYDTMRIYFKSLALIMNHSYQDVIPGENPIEAKTRRRLRTILFKDLARKICECSKHNLEGTGLSNQGLIINSYETKPVQLFWVVSVKRHRSWTLVTM